LAAYVAAGIAEADMNKTGWQGLALAAAGFLIPYIFLYNNELLLIGQGLNVTIAIVTAIIGVFFFAVGIQGYLTGKLNYVQRTIAVASGIAMLVPGWSTDLIGLIAFAIMVFVSKKTG